MCLGGLPPAGGHPVPAHRVLAGDGVWRGGGAAEEHPGVPAAVSAQPGTVLPAPAPVLPRGGQLQQGISGLSVCTSVVCLHISGLPARETVHLLNTES